MVTCGQARMFAISRLTTVDWEDPVSQALRTCPSHREVTGLPQWHEEITTELFTAR